MSDLAYMFPYHPHEMNNWDIFLQAICSPHPKSLYIFCSSIIGIVVFWLLMIFMVVVAIMKIRKRLEKQELPENESEE